MRTKGMSLPSKEDFEATLLALPGNYKEECWYEGGNIFHLLFNGKNKHTGWLRLGGSLNNEASDSYLWSSEDDTDIARAFKCGDTRGILDRSYRSSAYPLRALVQ